MYIYITISLGHELVLVIMWWTRVANGETNQENTFLKRDIPSGRLTKRYGHTHGFRMDGGWSSRDMRVAGCTKKSVAKSDLCFRGRKSNSYCNTSWCPHS